MFRRKGGDIEDAVFGGSDDVSHSKLNLRRVVQEGHNASVVAPVEDIKSSNTTTYIAPANEDGSALSVLELNTPTTTMEFQDGWNSSFMSKLQNLMGNPYWKK